MKSSTSTATMVVAPGVRITEQWALVYDGSVDLAVTFESEDAVREYIRKGVEEYDQDPARYGIAARHQVVITTSWHRIPM